MLELIPLPENFISTDDFYGFCESEATIFCSPELKAAKGMLETFTGISFKTVRENPGISFIYDSSEEDDSYSLVVDNTGVRVYAKSEQGSFYAVSTIRQLFDTDNRKSKWLSSHHVKITKDRPAYSWRGMHLDESRHFFGKQTVKKVLDYMAMYKLNVFHWHLTDDQGWRIQIDKYPLLTEIGSKRKGSQLKNWASKEVDFTPHGGFYTKDDIKEIVSYAKERFIDIVPEIDFPAHCASVLAAYNDLACREIECEVPYYFGATIPEKMLKMKSWNRTLCLGKDKVYEFVCDVLDEVAELFPFKYVHIGGDEAPTDEWKKCPCCQQKMKDENLKNETELQGYFTNKVNEHLRSLGKTVIGWNEILKAPLVHRDIVAQYWTPGKDENVAEHLKNGGKVILSCHKSFYFDMKFTYTTVKNCYCFKPEENNIPQDMLSSVMGLEAENWTEWTDSEKQLMFKLFPRIQALAENAWSAQSVKNYNDFLRRVQKQKGVLDKLGIYYGNDKLTLKKSPFYRRKMASKLKISLADYDCEYKISLAK